jgi:AcrR family transcriptional regulator
LTDGHARRRPAVSEKDKLHRRDEIMVAAKKVFAHNGFHATTIADIAKEAGLAYGSVYQYFDSKEELFDALMAAQEYALRTHLAVAMAATGARPDESWEPLRATAQATFDSSKPIGRPPSWCSATPTRWAIGSRSTSLPSTSGSSTTSRPSSSLPRSAAKWWLPRHDWWPTP